MYKSFTLREFNLKKKKKFKKETYHPKIYIN